MRGMRFASTLGFRIEEETLSAMLETKNLLQKIAKERITSEFRGVLLGESIYDVLMSCREIIYELIPELRIEDSYIMKKYPDITLWEHTVKSVSMSKIYVRDYVCFCTMLQNRLVWLWLMIKKNILIMLKRVQR